MAIRTNMLATSALGSRFKGEDTGDNTGSSGGLFNLGGVGAAIGGAPAQPAPAPARAPQTVMTAAPINVAATTAFSPAVVAALPEFVQPAQPIRPFPVRPLPFPVPFPLPVPQSRTTTQLARGAIDQLNSANPATVREA